jgi:CHAT domain-containing protein
MSVRRSLQRLERLARADREPRWDRWEEVRKAGSGERPYAHPYYWAAFIPVGDPDGAIRGRAEAL